ncbi:cyclophilin-like protein [Pholiota molesta]|nr:cyclophilin-like protein [Pholiota molesta]
MALPTNGKVILDTTEAPKATRNFLALSTGGYYDGVIFHRVVPGFLVQPGDRTGIGGGGESFYGGARPRLRFSHRSIVAMANNGTKNSNDSQFFITLDRADELHGKHTVFGRCILRRYSVHPPKIKSVRIVDNSFDDIRAKEQAQREREEEQRKQGAKK